MKKDNLQKNVKSVKKVKPLDKGVILKSAKKENRLMKAMKKSAQPIREVNKIINQI